MVFSLTTVLGGVKWTSEPGHRAHYGGSHGHSDRGSNGPGVSLSVHSVSRTDTNIARMPPLAAYFNRSSQGKKGWWLDQRQNSSVSVEVVELLFWPGYHGLFATLQTVLSVEDRKTINNYFGLNCAHNYHPIFLFVSYFINLLQGVFWSDFPLCNIVDKSFICRDKKYPNICIIISKCFCWSFS